MIIRQLLSQIKCNTLIQQTECITHRSVCRLCDIAKCFFFHFYLFCLHQITHTVCNCLNADSLEIIVLTSGKNRNWDFMHFCRRQNKNNILRRLLKCLKQCVKCSDGKHMHLVNNVYFILTFCRSICHFLPDLTDIINTIVRCSIDLDHIHRSTGGDRFTHLTLSARTSIYRVLTVYCLCKYFRNRCLSGSSRSAKQIRMSDPVRLNLVLKRCNNMILSFYIFEFRRTELSV